MYIDSANVDEIKELMSYGIFKGVTTNPTLLLNEGKERLMQLKNIAALNVGTFFIQLEGNTMSELVADFRLIEAEFENVDSIIYKIPINSEGILAIREIRLIRAHTQFLGTAIYSAEQMYMASLARCQYVAPYVNRMQVQGIDPFETIASAQRFIKDHNLTCQIMGASFKNSQQVKAVYDVGIDTVTLSKDVVMQMLERNLANQAILDFNNDGKKLKAHNN